MKVMATGPVVRGVLGARIEYHCEESPLAVPSDTELQKVER